MQNKSCRREGQKSPLDIILKQQRRGWGARWSRGWGREKPTEVATGKRESKQIIELFSKLPFKYSGSEWVRSKVVVWGLSKQQLWLIYYLMRPPSTAQADTGFFLIMPFRNSNKTSAGCAAYHLTCLVSDLICNLVFSFFDSMKMTKVKKKCTIVISNVSVGLFKKDVGTMNWLTLRVKQHNFSTVPVMTCRVSIQTYLSFAVFSTADSKWMC